MHGWLIGNGFFQNMAFSSLYDDLMQAAARQGISLTLRTNDEFCPLTDALFTDAPDFVLLWDKDVRLAVQLEARGLKVFNSSESVRLCDDKTLTYLKLSGDVPMPETIIAPLTFTDYGEARFLERVGERLAYPYVMKEGCGSFGQQVYLIESSAQARELLNKMGERPVLFQRFIKESFGRDVRVYVVGNRCVAAMERVNTNGDFRANIAGGGIARPHALTKAEESLALLSVRKLGLLFGGVDLLFSADGPLLCEVNSNAHFAALKALTHVDPADVIFEEIRKKCTDA